MTFPEYYADHVAKTQESIRPFHQQPVKLAILSAFAEECQELEDNLHGLLNSTIDTANGEILDAWGELVGEPRGGLTDGWYRRFIRARIITNTSNGTAEDLIAVVALTTGADEGSIRVWDRFPAGVGVDYTVRFPTPDDVRSRIHRQLLETIPSGVRLDEVVEGVDFPFAFLEYDGGPSGGFDEGFFAEDYT